LSRCGFYALAERDYDQALRLDDHLALAFGARGLEHFRRRDWKGAAADFTRAIQEQPEESDFLFRRAWSNHELGWNFGEIVTRNLTAGPSDYESWDLYILAMCQRSRGERVDAASSFERASAASRHNPTLSEPEKEEIGSLEAEARRTLRSN
jgi:tetratricopeptide (TPR) repeat protein